MKRIPLIAALLTLAMHLVANPHYGFFRDELYFIVCGFRPDWGYVDQPPVVPLLSAGSQLFGTSLFLLRALPALFAAGCVYVTCLLAIELGGGTFAVVLSALLAALMPILNAFGTKVSTDMPGLFLWPLIALLIARIANGANPRLWIWAGVAFGVCAEAKYTVFFYGAALLAGLLLTPARRIVKTPWFAAGVAAAVAIALPSFVWQSAHGWPFLEMIHNQQQTEVVIHSPLGYVVQQILITNPILAAIWIFGLVYAFVRPELRWIGWTYVVLIACMIAGHARNYYPGDVYPLLIACGALAIERTAALTRFRTAIVTAVAVISMLTLPFVFPVMAEAQLAAAIETGQRLVSLHLNTTRNDESPITQIFADMHGWPQLTATVARVYDALPPDQRARAAILARNFGEAGAIDVYGKAYGLPPALSGQNNYWIWGPRGYDGSVVVEVNGRCGPDFRSQRVAVARLHDRWAMPAESRVPISVCYGLKEPLARYWPKLKTFI
ncbi:MAG TPA: glycosyltransferase family 39 protein [Candidatus Baltobacteraceae bacterium]